MTGATDLLRLGLRATGYETSDGQKLLFYRQGPNLWRLVHHDPTRWPDVPAHLVNAEVGPQYASKDLLLADLHRYARDAGWVADSPVPLPDAPAAEEPAPAARRADVLVPNGQDRAFIRAQLKRTAVTLYQEQATLTNEVAAHENERRIRSLYQLWQWLAAPGDQPGDWTTGTTEERTRP